MEEWQKRTAMILGEDSIDILAHSKIAVFGLGGVGSYAVEALARAGVGELLLVDGDTFVESNINRQLYALPSTVGKPKSDASVARVNDINPRCMAVGINKFVTQENIDEFELERFDFVLDCIDNVKSKIALVVECREKNVNIISAMGAGNKLHPELFEISDISKTSVCPLAKVMRRELRLRGINHLKVVYSKELPTAVAEESDPSTGRRSPGSVSFAPSVMGLIMAGEAVRSLAERK